VPPSIRCEPHEVRQASSARATGDRAPSAPAGLGLSGPAVVGHLPTELIRSVIRSHGDAIRTCYEATLRSPPYPKGRVRARFVIDATGKVPHSCLASTTLDQPTAERCIVDEVLTWRFPKPADGGQVIVDYPWVLETRSDGDTTAAPAPKK